MYNIFGILNNGQNISQVLLQGLQHLKAQDYESVGIATVTEGQIKWQQASSLFNLVQQPPLEGYFGIAYTHWAEASEPNLYNAYLGVTDHIALVYKGKITNNKELREELLTLGYELTNETETEMILCLLQRYLDIDLSPEEAISITLTRLRGSFVIMVLFVGKTPQEDQLITVHRNHTLLIGSDNDVLYLASDIGSLKGISGQIVQLEEGNPVILRSVSPILKNSISSPNSGYH